MTVRGLHADAVERSDFRDYLRPILTRWWLVLLIVGIATAGTYVYSERLPKEYKSATSLYVSNPVTDRILFGTGTAPTDRDVANVAAEPRVVQTRDGVVDVQSIAGLRRRLHVPANQQ